MSFWWSILKRVLKAQLLTAGVRGAGEPCGFAGRRVQAASRPASPARWSSRPASFLMARPQGPDRSVALAQLPQPGRAPQAPRTKMLLFRGRFVRFLVPQIAPPPTPAPEGRGWVTKSCF